MKTYCLGFIIDDSERVLLIRKNRPEWQRGKLNGLGGHVEEGESPLDAMIRETREESGLNIPATHWRPVCDMKFDDCIVHVYVVNWSFYEIQGSPTDETLHSVDRACLPEVCLPNLHWLVPMAWQAMLRPVDDLTRRPLISFVQ